MANAAPLSDALNRAWSLLATGNVESAREIYSSILRENADNTEAIHGMALVTFYQGDHGSAIDQIGRVLEAKLNNPRHANTAGVICQGCGEVESALKHYKNAIQFIDRSPQVQEKSHQELRAEVQKNLRSLALFAQATYEDLIPLHWNQGDLVGVAALKLKLGNLCQEVDWIDQAIAHYRQGLEFRPAVRSAIPSSPGTLATVSALPVETTPGPSDVVDPSQGATAWQTPAPQQTTLKQGDDPFTVAIAQDSIFAQLYTQLAAAYAKQQQWGAVKAAAQAALGIDSKQHQAYRLLGDALMNQGQKQPAVDAYQAALHLNRQYVDGWFHLGSALLASNQLEDALRCYGEVLKIDGNHGLTHWNLGLTYDRLKKVPEALHHWQTALTLAPEQWTDSDYYLVANKLLGLDKKNEGMTWHERNIQRHPQTFASYWEMGEMLNVWSAYDHARRIANLFYDNAKTPEMRVLAGIMKTKTLCNIGLNQAAREVFESIEEELLEILPTVNSTHFVRIFVNALFDVPHIRDDVFRNSQLAIALGKRYLRHITDQIANTLKAQPALAPVFDKGKRSWGRRSPGRPLRLGFMSKHFRRHSVGWCSAQIFEALKAMTPHLFFYVTGDLKRDDRTVLFEAVAEKFYWPNTPELPDSSSSSLAKRVLEDELDVLVDLDSITVLPHADVLHLEPAPVCVTWLGYDAPHINPNNYNLVDWHTHPAGVERHYVEKLIRMPGAFAAIDKLPIAHTSRELQRRSLRIGEDQVVFLCVATGQKFSRAMVQAQINVVKQVPDSLLLFKSRVGDLELMLKTYREECDRQGVARSRVRFIPRSASEEEHRTIYLVCDVLLDSYPYSGATHNLEALYFNLPIVTRVGEQSFSRLGYSLMRAAGITEGTTWSWTEYIEWGVKLGLDQELRELIREKLRRGKEAEHLQLLWNPKQFATDMYRIFEDLRDRVDGPAPALPATPATTGQTMANNFPPLNTAPTAAAASDSGMAIASF